MIETPKAEWKGSAETEWGFCLEGKQINYCQCDVKLTFKLPGSKLSV